METPLFVSPSTLDRKSLLLTIFINVIGIAAVGVLFFALRATAPVAKLIITGFAAVIVSGGAIAGFICTPHQYILTKSELIIRRHIGNAVIPLADLRAVRLMTPADKKGIWRSFGSEGMFGVYGYYSSPRFKRLTVFARRYNHWTLLITERKKYVIAPDDLQLVDRVLQQAGLPQGGQSLAGKPETLRRDWMPMAGRFG